MFQKFNIQYGGFKHVGKAMFSTFQILAVAVN